MSRKDIFDHPFDEGTLAKLEIFEKYVDSWLPTFIMGKISKPIQIFDLFAGSGYDKLGVPGSPIRILEVINKHRKNLAVYGKKVKLFLNDSDAEKIDKLQFVVNEEIKELSLVSIVDVTYSKESFKECLYNKFITDLKKGCNLIFIDQNGFKQVDEITFQFLINLHYTDFIFFISSSYIHRFAQLEEVQKVHPKFDFDKIRNTSRKKVHNIICEEYEKYVPKNIGSFSLYPFTIMKEDHSNIYGLIFVSKHPLGADKFLNTVWKQNAINGNANFDIDDDLTKDQLHIFDGQRLTKIESFQKLLRDKILKKEINNNVAAYLFALNQGHISHHADLEIRKLKKEKLIYYNTKTPLVNYEQVVKNRRKIEYEVID